MSLLAVGFSPETLIQFGAVAGLGGLLGMTKCPEFEENLLTLELKVELLGVA